MFDISDMAKAAFDPILSTPLQIAQKGECNSTIGGEGKRQLSISPQKKHVENNKCSEENSLHLVSCFEFFVEASFLVY